jgi:uncharacterized cupin superfamily protein
MGEVPEAELVQTEAGRRVEGEGWFVLNVADAVWETTQRGGTWSLLEADEPRFEQFGIGVHVLLKGEMPGFYHAESAQEGFLVLSGECLAIVEGQERRMRQWDYLHCPPGTRHITVGTSEEPCAILMVGTRMKGKTITYPVDPVAAAHGASVQYEAHNAPDAYAQWQGPRTFTRVAAPWPPAPSAA